MTALTALARRSGLLEQLAAIAGNPPPGVPLGTVNQAQGLEREAVVVVHPLAGYRDAPGFATDPGRLCVALSRHRAHLTVITDPATPAVLNRACAADPHDRAAAVQREVLHSLSQPSGRP